MEDRALRLTIRAKLETGRLPHESIPRAWGGSGNGQTCDGCDETITKAEYMMEGADVKGSVVQFHVKCFYLWAAEQHGALAESGALDIGRAAVRSERAYSQRPTSRVQECRTILDT